MDPDQYKAEVASLRLDAAALRELIRLPEWAVFKRRVEWAMDAWKERTIVGSRDDFDYNKGVVMGIRDTLTLPESVIFQIDKIDKE